ncbi:MAG: hypothetical protein MJ229_05330 [bacterium]|nr:hypothetical protein [bacterium]
MPIQEELREKNILTPQEVREILSIDNKGIVELCKQSSVIPKKDSKGQTYFSQEEVQKMKRAKKSQKNAIVLSKNDSDLVINNLLSSLDSMENRLSNRMSKLIDDKLDGMDEVVVELIRCKTENETLRQKLNELNKENYQLKKTVQSYKSVGLGLYVKKEIDDFSL